MPYIGNDIRANEDYKIIDDISSGFNGSATSFALQVGGSAPVPFPKFEQQLLISVNGVIQEPDPSGSAGFRLSGTNIVFSSAPTNGHAFFGVIYAGADYLNAGGTFPSGTASVPSITFSSDTDTGIFSPSSGAVAITSNGTKVAQFPTAQGSSGQALVTDGAGVLSFATPSGTTASSITVADESSDTTCFPIFTTGATGSLGPKSGSNLTFNSSSGLLTATSFSGSGASLTSLNASNISSGTISASRVPTLNQNTTGSAATLTTARTIGGVSFDGSANINLPGVNTSGNQNTSGTAAIATTISVGDESSDTTCFPVFTTAASGNLAPKTGSNITFNSSSGLLTATSFSGSGASLTSLNASNISSGTISASRVPTLNQNTTGSAATLTTARTIGGVSFDGSANINLPGVNTSGNQNTSGTAAIATTISVGDESSDTTCFPVFTTAASGNLAPKTGSNITFNSSSGLLTATEFSGSGASLTALNIVTDTSPQLGGNLDCNGNDITGNGNIDLPDNSKIKLGTGDDLQMYHTGSASFIDAYTSNLQIRNDGSEVMASFNRNSGVELYFNNVKKFESTVRGVEISGNATNPLSSLSDGSTITVDFGASCNFTVTLGGNRTFGDPDNTASSVGSSGSIFIVQDGTGSRTASFHADYKFPGGTAPTLSTAANAIDRLDYIVRADNNVHCVVTLDVK